MVERYGGNAEPGAAPTAADVGVFLVARDAAGHAVACGGLRRLGEEVAEIKRMYVRPEARGQGLGRAMLEALEREARAAGFTRLRLETGVAQPEALALCEAAGYEPVPCFGAYAGESRSRCYERRLEPQPKKVEAAS